MILDKGVIIHELGSIDYKECWDLQENIFSDMADAKISDRKNGTVTSIEILCYLGRVRCISSRINILSPQ